MPQILTFLLFLGALFLTGLFVYVRHVGGALCMAALTVGLGVALYWGWQNQRRASRRAAGGGR